VKSKILKVKIVAKKEAGKAAVEKKKKQVKSETKLLNTNRIRDIKDMREKTV